MCIRDRYGISRSDENLRGIAVSVKSNNFTGKRRIFVIAALRDVKIVLDQRVRRVVRAFVTGRHNDRRGIGAHDIDVQVGRGLIAMRLSLIHI